MTELPNDILKWPESKYRGRKKPDKGMRGDQPSVVTLQLLLAATQFWSWGLIIYDTWVVSICAFFMRLSPQKSLPMFDKPVAIGKRMTLSRKEMKTWKGSSCLVCMCVHMCACPPVSVNLAKVWWDLQWHSCLGLEGTGQWLRDGSFPPAASEGLCLLPVKF